MPPEIVRVMKERERNYRFVPYLNMTPFNKTHVHLCFMFFLSGMQYLLNCDSTLCQCIIFDLTWEERIPAGLGTDAEIDGPLQPVSALPAARCTRHTSYWLFLLVLAFKWWPRINEMMIDNSWAQTCTMLIQTSFELYWIVTKPAIRVWWMEEGAYAWANIVVGGWLSCGCRCW